MREIGVEVPAAAGWGKCIDEVFSTLVEPTLVQPTIVMDYPVALSPLAKSKAGEPRIVERFEAFIGGFEIANAYSELNDPIEQRLRFELQAQERAARRSRDRTIRRGLLVGAGARDAADRRFGPRHRTRLIMIPLRTRPSIRRSHPLSTAPVSSARGAKRGLHGTASHGRPVLSLQDGRALLHWHRKNRLWLPFGGHLEANEDPVQTVIREVEEECGLVVELLCPPNSFGIRNLPVVAPPVVILVEPTTDGVTEHQHIDMIYFCRPVSGA